MCTLTFLSHHVHHHTTTDPLCPQKKSLGHAECTAHSPGKPAHDTVIVDRDVRERRQSILAPSLPLHIDSGTPV